MAGYDLLLAGGGHTHLMVLRQWRRQPLPGRIALINETPNAWYSGMMARMLHGYYRADQCQIPLEPLCNASGVTFIEGRIERLLPQARGLQLVDGRLLETTTLALDVGSQPWLPTAESGASLEVLPVKPFSRFAARWAQWQRAVQPLAIIGGGAAGVELAMALACKVPSLALFSRGPLLRGHPPALRRRALRHLSAAGVAVHEGVAIEAVSADALMANGLPVWCGSRALAATGSKPLPWLAASGLSSEADGFVAVDERLQSRSHGWVFAAGDCAAVPGATGNGVHAVRQGATLAANLGAVLAGRPATKRYRPQRHSLALLADGHGGALLSWSRWTAEGHWLGDWKHRLDSRFVNDR